MKYRRKSLEVEAIQYKLENNIEVKKFIKEINNEYKILPTFSNNSLVIDMLTEVINVRLNDYIVKDLNNELYVSCKEIFEELFEKVNDECFVIET